MKLFNDNALVLRRYYCPTVDEVRATRICYRPPPRPVLIAKIKAKVESICVSGECSDEDMINKLLETVSLLEQKQADQKWCLQFLQIVSPDDEIWQKSYKYERPKTQIEEVEYEVDNRNNFFDDLPKLPIAYMKKTKTLRVPK